MGFTGTADVVVPCNGIAGKQIDFAFDPRVGLRVQPRHGLVCVEDGVTVAVKTKPAPLLYEGSVLQVGEAVLEVRLLPGLRVSRPAPEGPTLFGRPVAAQTDRPREQLTLFGQPVADDAEGRAAHGQETDTEA